MPPPHRIDPLEALELLVQRLGRASPRSHALKEAPGGYLARALEVELRSGGSFPPIAKRNVLALPAGAKSGDVVTVLGVVTRTGVLPANVQPEPGQLGVWRVESGAPKPDGFDRAVPLEQATLVGSGLLRLDALAGLDLDICWEKAPGTLSFPAGTFLDQRVKAVLELARVSQVELMTPATVALVLLGDELRSPHSGQAVEDLTGPWLGAALKALGCSLLDLGQRPETAESLRDAILHCRGRAEILVLVGGLGDGFTDRTLENVERFDAKFTFHGVACDGASRLFHARALGMDIVGLGGKPLEAASGFDLFLAPALLARQQAPRTDWDWSLGKWPAEGKLLAVAPDSWIVRPAKLEPIPGGGWEAHLVPPSGVWSQHPLAPGQSGWAVVSPASVQGVRRVYYQRLFDGRKALQQ